MLHLFHIYIYRERRSHSMTDHVLTRLNINLCEQVALISVDAPRESWEKYCKRINTLVFSVPFSHIPFPPPPQRDFLQYFILRTLRSFLKHPSPNAIQWVTSLCK